MRVLKVPEMQSIYKYIYIYIYIYIYSWNFSTCICENGQYLKRIADTSVI